MTKAIQHKTVTMVIRTPRVDNDERLLKELRTLDRLGVSTRLLCVCNAAPLPGVLPKNTKVDVRVSAENFVRQKASTLWLLVKLCKWFFVRHQRSDVVWIHDPVLITCIPLVWFAKKLGLCSTVIWDLHELPPQRMLSSGWLQSLFLLAVCLCDKVIHANEYRKQHIEQLAGVTESKSREVRPSKHRVLRNYPELSSDGCEPEKPDFHNQLPEQFIYVQSGFGEHRNFGSLATALSRFPEINVVLTGRHASPEQELQALHQNCLVLGMVSPKDITYLFERAQCSIILYQSNFGLNNHFCEPNRLFHAIKNRCPVIVGNNPPMAEEVEIHHAGIVLDDDGSSVDGLVQAITHMLNKHHEFYNDVEAPCWELQQDTFVELIS